MYGMAAGLPAATKAATLVQMNQIPLSVHNCPSRRTRQTLPFTEPSHPLYGANAVTTLAHTDYAANCGDASQPYDLSGPTSLAIGDQWTASNAWTPPNTTFDILHFFTGISYIRSRVGLANLSGGASNVYLIGEKYLIPDNYYTGLDPADDQPLFVGFDNDNYRSTISPPMQDTPGEANYTVYGSAHFGTYNASFCDGSVHAISYAIDPLTHQHLGNRNSVVAIDPTKL